MIKGAILPRKAGEGDRPEDGGGGNPAKSASLHRYTHTVMQRRQRGHVRAPQETIANARRLRRNLSPPEARLWTRLRARAPGMPVFRRQHPVGPYVLDFYCAKALLAVEIDGMSHDTADRPERDARKDAWLRERGIAVMRVPAVDVARQINDVADAIVRLAMELTTPTTVLRTVPLPRFAGED